ncbi:phBC6A51 family helix-turn-helix protein [Bacillaceae bacterium C204]|uniref:phBC6A51 family helix-turn-helix protein n=1 Tax=Neobacillus sp. 204 TaxID=3383351 RepID=UPI00397AA828
MSDEKLNKQQLAAAQLLAIGTIDKQDIAKSVGCSKQTLYNWINKNKAFMAEVDSIRRDYKNFGQQIMEAKLIDAVNGYWDLIHKTNNPMVAKGGYEFFIERSLGKVTNNIKLSTEIDNTKIVDQDVLEAEFAEFEQDSEE